MKRIPFDTGWKFHLEDEFDQSFGTTSTKNQEAWGLPSRHFNATYWDDVNLPHDWGMTISYTEEANRSHGHKPTSPLGMDGYAPGVKRDSFTPTVGWYRKSFFVPGEWLGKRVYLEFDGVFRDARVWINGQFFDRYASGYIGFRCDITDNLYYGADNVVAVASDSRDPEGWWYEGGGIYRHVRLVVCEAFHLDALNIRTETDMHGRFFLTGSTVNDGEKTQSAILSWALTRENAVCLEGECAVNTASWSEATFTFESKLDNPALWSTDEPNLYTLTIRLVQSGVTIDEESMMIGFRTFRFDANEGLFVNEVPVKIKGACIHQDFAGVGVALPDDIHAYKIRRLKEMGMNAYRSSHNAPAPEIVDACDRLGMLLMDETRMFGSAPDALRSTEALIRRDRNHACVLMWSIGNEEHSVQNTPVGARIAQTVIRAIRRLDPSRYITYGGNNGGEYDGVNAQVDVRGVNYVHIHKESFVDEYHAAHPGQPMFGSEEVSILMTRGEYRGSTAYPPAYGEHAMQWSSTAEGWWKFYMERPFLAGSFIWTGFDYFGEPTPYERNSLTSFGAIDICGFPKDVYYYYQSQWLKKDILHLFPHWNWNEGETVRVIAYSNLEEVELFVNGRSFGRQLIQLYDHAEWLVPFEPGVLEAVGYRDGNEILRDRRVTAGDAHQISVTAEPAMPGSTIYLVHAEILDEDGNPVPDARNLLHLNAKGGHWLGVGNGDPASREPDQFGYETLRQEIIDWTVGDDRTPWNAFTLRSNEHYIVHTIAQTKEIVENKPPFRDARRIVFRAAAKKMTEHYAAEFIPDDLTMNRLDFARLEGNYKVTLNGEELGSGNTQGWPVSFDVKLQKGVNRLTVECSDVYEPGGVYLGVWLSKKQPLPWTRKAFHGLALGILQTDGPDATVTVSSDGLTSGTVQISENY